MIKIISILLVSFSFTALAETQPGSYTMTCRSAKGAAQTVFLDVTAYDRDVTGFGLNPNASLSINGQQVQDSFPGNSQGLDLVAQPNSGVVTLAINSSDMNVNLSMLNSTAQWNGSTAGCLGDLGTFEASGTVTLTASGTSNQSDLQCTLEIDPACN